MTIQAKAKETGSIQTRMQRAQDNALEMGNTIARAGRFIEHLEWTAEQSTADPGANHAVEAARIIAEGWDKLANLPGTSRRRTEEAYRHAGRATQLANVERLHIAGARQVAQDLAEELGELTEAWAERIAAHARGRNSDLILHIAERDHQTCVWAEELDPSEQHIPTTDDVELWVGTRPNPAMLLDPKRLPNAARIHRIAWALGLRGPVGYTGIDVEVTAPDGRRGNAPSIRMTAGETATRLAISEVSRDTVKSELGDDAAEWLAQHQA